jgi:membrane peptidoglycan carboxypeptidase
VKTIPLQNARNQEPTKDPYHAAAVERGKAAVGKLQQQTIIDSQGRRIRTDLPADMQEGMDRDFG